MSLNIASLPELKCEEEIGEASGNPRRVSLAEAEHANEDEPKLNERYRSKSACNCTKAVGASRGSIKPSPSNYNNSSRPRRKRRGSASPILQTKETSSTVVDSNISINDSRNLESTSTIDISYSKENITGEEKAKSTPSMDVIPTLPIDIVEQFDMNFTFPYRYSADSKTFEINTSPSLQNDLWELKKWNSGHLSTIANYSTIAYHLVFFAKIDFTLRLLMQCITRYPITTSVQLRLIGSGVDELDVSLNNSPIAPYRFFKVSSFRLEFEDLGTKEMDYVSQIFIHLYPFVSQLSFSRTNLNPFISSFRLLSKLESLTFLSEHFINLIISNIHHLPNLRTITVHTEGINSSTLESVLQAAPWVTELFTSNNFHFTSSTIRYLHSIERLVVQFSDEPLSSLTLRSSDSLHALTRLDFNLLPMLENSFFIFLATQVACLPSLLRLRVSNCYKVQNSGLELFLKHHGKGIAFLHLEGLPLVTKAIIDSVRVHCLTLASDSFGILLFRNMSDGIINGLYRPAKNFLLKERSTNTSSELNQEMIPAPPRRFQGAALLSPNSLQVSQ